LLKTGPDKLHVSPDGVERVKRDVEADFPGKTFDADEYGVAEPNPTNQTQAKQPVAGRRLVQIQYQSRIKNL